MGDDILDMNNILSGDEAAALFDDSYEEKKPPQDNNNNENNPEEKNDDNNEDATEVDSSEFFSDETEKPESVGSGKDTEQKDTTSEEAGASPTDFYSSIASALKEEGVFLSTSDEDINSISSAEDFRDLFKREIEAGLDEAQKRVYDALNSGVEPSAIQQYERTLGFLNDITEEQLNDESADGENLRRRLLLQDFLNRGYSQERAVKMTDKLFDTGSDIEEAKQALVSNKEYFGDKYNDLLTQAKKEEEDARKALKKQAEDLKNDILKSDKIFGDVPIDKITRQKVYDNISKPIYKDPETGEWLTSLQKYRKENENNFIKNVGIIYTLTDGFTNLEKLVSPTAKKEVKKKLKDLEHTLNNTARNNGGVLEFVGNTGATGKSIFDGLTLDV